jgi:hypothetical protein
VNIIPTQVILRTLSCFILMNELWTTSSSPFSPSFNTGARPKPVPAAQVSANDDLATTATTSPQKVNQGSTHILSVSSINLGCFLCDVA